MDGSCRRRRIREARRRTRREIPRDGVVVGVDDVVGHFLVEIPKDLLEGATEGGRQIERHHVVGVGHPASAAAAYALLGDAVRRTGAVLQGRHNR